MTDIEQRATEWAKSVSPWETIYDESRKMDYMLGATEQRKIDIEKAVAYIMITPAYAVQPEIYAEGLRKALEAEQ